MLLIAAMIMSSIAVFLLAVRPFAGVLCIFLVKPVIDATWNSHLFGFNALKFMGAMVPIVFLIRFFLLGENKRRGMPLKGVWISYLFVNLLTVVMIVATGNFMAALEIFLRILNGFVGFYLLQTYVTNREQFRKFVIVLILAGFFPIGMGVYQAATGVVWRERMTVGLMRNVGFYHDAFSFRAYAYSTIVGILLYWSYFIKRSVLVRLFLVGFGAACAVVIFKIYSKAGYAIFVLWTATWTIFNKKILWLVVICVGIVGANILLGNKIYHEVEQVFSRETAAIDGTGRADRALAGRYSVWTEFYSIWEEADFIGQFFGTGNPAGRAHNDYLRVLVSGGVVGLAAYVLLIVVVGWKVLINLFRSWTPLNLVAAMVFMMYFIDTIGLTPAVYPAYQWLCWGVIGLALRGVDGLEQKGRAA